MMTSKPLSFASRVMASSSACNVRSGDSALWRMCGKTPTYRSPVVHAVSSRRGAERTSTARLAVSTGRTGTRLSLHSYSTCRHRQSRARWFTSTTDEEEQLPRMATSRGTLDLVANKDFSLFQSPNLQFKLSCPHDTELTLSRLAIGGPFHPAVACSPKSPYVARPAEEFVTRGGNLLILAEGMEKDFGSALTHRLSRRGISRDQVFVCSAVSLRPHSLDSSLSTPTIDPAGFDASLTERLARFEEAMMSTPDLVLLNHLEALGHSAEEIYGNLHAVFKALEKAVQQGHIRGYGVSTARVTLPENHPLYLSVANIHAVAQAAAGSNGNKCGFRVLAFPVSPLAPAALQLKNQDKGTRTALEAAKHLELSVWAQSPFEAYTARDEPLHMMTFPDNAAGRSGEEVAKDLEKVFNTCVSLELGYDDHAGIKAGEDESPYLWAQVMFQSQEIIRSFTKWTSVYHTMVLPQMKSSLGNPADHEGSMAEFLSTYRAVLTELCERISESVQNRAHDQNMPILDYLKEQNPRLTSMATLQEAVISLLLAVRSIDAIVADPFAMSHPMYPLRVRLDSHVPFMPLSAEATSAQPEREPEGKQAFDGGKDKIVNITDSELHLMPTLADISEQEALRLIRILHKHFIEDGHIVEQ